MRDTCALLSVMVECFGDKLKLFMRDTFAAILEGIKVPNKVMSGYVDDCIMYLISNSTFKSAVPLITTEVRESKAKQVKERCMVTHFHYPPPPLPHTISINMSSADCCCCCY